MTTNTDRLQHLATKQMLTPVEEIELRDLMLERQSLSIARQRSVLAQTRRKTENRRKYEIGGLAFKAAVQDFDDASLLGALMNIAALRDNPQHMDRWRQTGALALAAKK